MERLSRTRILTQTASRRLGSKPLQAVQAPNANPLRIAREQTLNSNPDPFCFLGIDDLPGNVHRRSRGREAAIECSFGPCSTRASVPKQLRPVAPVRLRRRGVHPLSSFNRPLRAASMRKTSRRHVASLNPRSCQAAACSDVRSRNGRPQGECSSRSKGLRKGMRRSVAAFPQCSRSRGGRGSRPKLSFERILPSRPCVTRST
jgi:hypothetical protein